MVLDAFFESECKCMTISSVDGYAGENILMSRRWLRMR